MSEEKAAEAPASPGPAKAPLLLALINTLAVLAAIGTLYYTKIMYKRPEITEETERKRLEEAHRQKTVTEATAPGSIHFGPVTVNTEADPAPQPSTDGHAENDASGEHPGAAGAIKGKLHYVTMAFSVEVIDGGQAPAIEDIRAVVMDELLSHLAHKSYHELATVQGRYILRSYIMDLVNRLTQNLDSHPPLLASSITKPATKDAHGGGEHGAPPAAAGGDAHGGGGEHGGGGHGDTKSAKAEEHHQGPPIKEIYPDGIATNVYFTQFIVQ